MSYSDSESGIAWGDYPAPFSGESDLSDNESNSLPTSSRFVLQRPHSTETVVKEHYKFQPGLVKSPQQTRNRYNFNSRYPIQNNFSEQRLTEEEIKGHIDSSLEVANEGFAWKKLTVDTQIMVSCIRADNYGAMSHEDVTNRLNKIMQILELLFQSSSHSLEELEISQSDLLLLQRIIVRLPRLERLTKLIILSSIPKKYLLKINLTRLFPKLKCVRISMSKSCAPLSFYLNEMLQQNIQTENRFPISVTTLELKSICLPRSNSDDAIWPMRCDHDLEETREMYRKLFPYLKEICIFDCHDFQSNCMFLWKTWRYIEKIQFKGVDETEFLKNIDQTFTGIPRTIWKIMLESENFLIDYENNPSGNSIRNLTSLKEMRIEIIHQRTCQQCDLSDSIINGPDAPFISSAAVACTIDQMPDCDFNLVFRNCGMQPQRKCYFLHHLRNFVTFTNLNFGRFDG